MTTSLKHAQPIASMIPSSKKKQIQNFSKISQFNPDSPHYQLKTKFESDT